MKFKLSNIFFGRNGYLIVIAAWLVTISFIIDNYWGDSSEPGVKKAIQKDIQDKQKDFVSFYNDTALIRQLISRQYSEATLTQLTGKKYFIFI